MEAALPTYSRLREPYFTGHESPLPDYSLYCEHCQGPLAGASGQRCPQCNHPFDIEKWKSRRPWFEATAALRRDIPLAVTIALLDECYVPYFVEQSRDPFGSSVTRLLVRREFFFDLLWILSQARLETKDQTRVEPRSAWICPSCAEKNPAHFELCWQCQRERNQAT